MEEFGVDLLLAFVTVVSSGVRSIFCVGGITLAGVKWALVGFFAWNEWKKECRTNIVPHRPTWSSSLSESARLGSQSFSKLAKWLISRPNIVPMNATHVRPFSTVCNSWLLWATDRCRFRIGPWLSSYRIVLYEFERISHILVPWTSECDSFNLVHTMDVTNNNNNKK